MASLKRHDGKQVCEIFGLANSGALCYLNSLVQALASCPAFVDAAQICDKSAQTPEADLRSKLFQLFSKHLASLDSVSPNPTSPDSYKKIKTETAGAILAAIQVMRTNRKHTLVTGQQEDVFEGFKFLVEALGNGFPEVFYTRNTLLIRCLECNTDRKVPKESCPAELTINMSDADPELQDRLDTQEAVEKYVKQHMLYPDEYICEKCKAQNRPFCVKCAVSKKADCDRCRKKNADGKTPVQQFYSLCRVSSVIVMSFHENMQILFDRANHGVGGERVARFFPNELRIKAHNATLVYRVVAQIEHSGQLGGGHYTAKCLRPRPSGFSQLRCEAAKRALRESTERLAFTQAPDRIRDLKTRAANAQRVIDEETAFAVLPEASITDLDAFIKKHYACFKFNDNTVTYDVHGFVPTPNTYLVFYHLFLETP